jgi:hypothetical protein
VSSSAERSVYAQTENTMFSIKYANGESKNAGIGEEIIYD